MFYFLDKSAFKLVIKTKNEGVEETRTWIKVIKQCDRIPSFLPRGNINHTVRIQAEGEPITNETMLPKNFIR